MDLFLAMVCLRKNLKAIARDELKSYSNVAVRFDAVERIERSGKGFDVYVGTNKLFTRKVLIATGVTDQLPQVTGFNEVFGISAFQCPYCDGWEFRHRGVAVYGKATRGLEMARAMTAWTRDIVLCTDGPCELARDQKENLARNGVSLIEKSISHLISDDGFLREICFRDGTRLAREALFFDMPSDAQSDLTGQLACRYNREGGVLCGQYEATSTPGVYVAGNIIRNVQLAIVAAAEGANAAFGINRALTREDFDQHVSGVSRIEHTAPAAEPLNNR